MENKNAKPLPKSLPGPVCAQMTRCDILEFFRHRDTRHSSHEVVQFASRNGYDRERFFSELKEALRGGLIRGCERRGVVLFWATPKLQRHFRLMNAVQWLESQLRQGPRPANEIKQAAQRTGIQRRLLIAAKQRAGAIAIKGRSRTDRRWWWYPSPQKKQGRKCVEMVQI